MDDRIGTALSGLNQFGGSASSQKVVAMMLRSERTPSASEVAGRLKHLLSTVPELQPGKAAPSDFQAWLAAAYALVELVNILGDTFECRTACDTISAVQEPMAMEKLLTTLHRAHAKASLLASEPSGGFIPVAQPLDAMVAVGQVMRHAARSVRIVDPYVSDKTVSDFVITAKEGVSVELLYRKPEGAFVPAVRRFVEQYGTARPLTVRQAKPRALHDRVIIIDGSAAFAVSQSLKDLAKDSPATIIKADAELARMKIEAYEQIWQESDPFDDRA
jgi:hypothetical protein